MLTKRRRALHGVTIQSRHSCFKLERRFAAEKGLIMSKECNGRSARTLGV